ncbi:MAG TPA: radical SAM protein, partial [Chitinophagales bacterium]|nr:radical SAM protein [Chitinophagales bacterium]
MHITLIRPSRLLKPFNKSLFPAAPLGLAFVAAILEKHGHHVTVIDAIAEKSRQVSEFKHGIVLNGLTNKEVINPIPANTDLIGLSCMFTQDWPNTRRLINEIGLAFPNATIIAGGEHITALPEFCLSQCPSLNLCVVGEGEETVDELCTALANKTGLSNIQGIVYRDNDGTFKKTERRKRIREIGAIALPAWHLFPVKSYFEEGLFMSVGVKRSLPILATRGCPYTCTFCSSPNMWGTRYFMRDPADVVGEIQGLIKTYDIDGIELFDLTAVINANWIISFAKELISRNVKINWQLPSGTRSEAITKEVAHYMKLSGCKIISYAPESGSEEILGTIKKKVSLSKLLKAVRHSNQENLIVKVLIIIGTPYETHKTVWQTMLLLLKCSWN